MKLSISLLALLLAFAGISLAQDTSGNPAPHPGDEILGPQLIAWSHMQEPQPVPQNSEKLSLPESNQSAEVARSEESTQQPVQKNAGDIGKEQKPAAQTLTGTVIKMGDKYALKTADKVTYILDDQEKAKEHDGKQVRVVGSLDRNGNLLHVSSIELLS